MRCYALVSLGTDNDEGDLLVYRKSLGPLDCLGHAPVERSRAAEVRLGTIVEISLLYSRMVPMDNYGDVTFGRDRIVRSKMKNGRHYSPPMFIHPNCSRL